MYLLGFNHKDPVTSAKKYLEDDGNPYDFVGVDSDGLIALEFGVFGLPETYLINEDGKIIYKFMGPITKDVLKNEIEPLLRILRTIILCFICFAFKTYAVENIDERVKNLTLELRCMTCQNQSIYDSDAEFSNDIKKIVKQKLQEGESERDIKKFLVERYSEYILFRPVVNYNNIFLWSFPFILLIIGLFFVLIKSKRNKV